MPLGGAQQHIM